MFTREVAPLNLPILFIASLFLNLHFIITSGGILRPLRLTAGEIPNKNLEVFQRLVRLQIQTLDSANVFSVYRCGILRRSKIQQILGSVVQTRMPTIA
jgi:hypothetical protein